MLSRRQFFQRATLAASSVAMPATATVRPSTAVVLRGVVEGLQIRARSIHFAAASVVRGCTITVPWGRGPLRLTTAGEPVTIIHSTIRVEAVPWWARLWGGP